jgi:hypothetical protein
MADCRDSDFHRYPLSVGPFAFLAGTGHVPDSIMALGMIYTPLELIGQAAPSIGAVIHNYGDAFYRQGLRFR